MKTLSAKQKWIYSSSVIALFSMFLPWFVWGMRSDNGWESDYYVVLACWFVPLVSAYNHADRKAVNVISLLLGSMAFVVFIGETASIRLLGDTYSSKVGAGAYVYLLAWLAAVYSEFMVSNENYDTNNLSGNAVNVSTDEELYLQVERDFESNKIDEALWVKSLTLCDGDKDKAKFKYIRDQVSKLEQGAINSNKIKKTTFRDIAEGFIKKISIQSEDETFKKSRNSMVLGVLSILGVIGFISFIDVTFLAVILLGLALTASIGGFVLGLVNMTNKQGVSKRMSIIGIVLSGMVLALFLSVIVFAA